MFQEHYGLRFKGIPSLGAAVGAVPSISANPLFSHPVKVFPLEIALTLEEK